MHAVTHEFLYFAALGIRGDDGALMTLGRMKRCYADFVLGFRGDEHAMARLDEAAQDDEEARELLGVIATRWHDVARDEIVPPPTTTLRVVPVLRWLRTEAPVVFALGHALHNGVENEAGMFLRSESEAFYAFARACRGDDSAMIWLAQQPRETLAEVNASARRAVEQERRREQWATEAEERTPRIEAAKEMGAGIDLAEEIAKETRTVDEARAIARKRVPALIERSERELEAAITLSRTDALAAYEVVARLNGGDAGRRLCPDEQPRAKSLAAATQEIDEDAPDDVRGRGLRRQAYALHKRVMDTWSDLYDRTAPQRAEVAAAGEIS